MLNLSKTITAYLKLQESICQKLEDSGKEISFQDSSYFPHFLTKGFKDKISFLSCFKQMISQNLIHQFFFLTVVNIKFNELLHKPLVLSTEIVLYIIDCTRTQSASIKILCNEILSKIVASFNPDDLFQYIPSIIDLIKDTEQLEKGKFDLYYSINIIRSIVSNKREIYLRFKNEILDVLEAFWINFSKFSFHSMYFFDTLETFLAVSGTFEDQKLIKIHVWIAEVLKDFIIQSYDDNLVKAVQILKKIILDQRMAHERPTII